MTQFPSRLAASSLVPLLALTALPVAADTPGLPAAAARRVDYAKDVQPILANNFYSCHRVTKQQSGFRLDRWANTLKGGELGKAIVPGKSAESPLTRYVAGVDPDLK